MKQLKFLGGWIKVTDELPGTYTHCLCYDGEGMFLGYLSLHEEWWEFYGGTRNVTHYMLLPNKQENEKEQANGQ